MRRAFATIGRLELGDVSLKTTSVSDLSAESGICLGSTQPQLHDAGVSSGVRLTVSVRDPQGQTRVLSAWERDLVTAVSQALHPLARHPFSIEVSMRQEGGHQGLSDSTIRYRVLVHCTAEGQEILGSGDGTGRDDASALCAAVLRALCNARLLRTAYRIAGDREVQEVAQNATHRIVQLFGSGAVDPETRSTIHSVLLDELHRFAVAQTIVMSNDPRPQRRLARFDASAVVTDEAGHSMENNTETENWWEWYPGIDNDHLTLRAVYGTLPAAPPTAIPGIVRLFENPKSWFRFRGAIDLAAHDLLHIVLGRGLLDQDEAFVLGFTMGTTKNLLRIERLAFKFLLARVYPEPYRIPYELLPAYDLGVEAGTSQGIKKIYQQPLERFLDRTLGAIRRDLQIDTRRLRDSYRREQLLLPGTLASVRLPVLLPGLS